MPTCMVDSSSRCPALHSSSPTPRTPPVVPATDTWVGGQRQGMRLARSRRLYTERLRAYTAGVAGKGKPSGTPRKRRGVKLQPTELSPRDLAVADLPPEIRGLAEAVEGDGGAVLASYREPLGGHVLLLCALPVDRVAPTPFPRDVSDAHGRRLTQAMDKTKRFLDPVIAVREERAAATDGEDARKVYWIPNGYHRLTALKELGAKTLLALLVPETAVAYQILALNIEKAHNL